LVKGASWDTETVLAQQWHWPIPVWEQKWQSDTCFERMSRVLIENHEHLHGAFAGHNIRSLSHAMALRQLHEVPDSHFELQMLYGMADPLKRAGVAMGERVRVYTPYGELLPGMAYLIRRLLENTSNESFLRLTVSADTPREELLEDPVLTGQRTPPPVKRGLIRYEFGEPIMDTFVNVPDTDFSKDESRRAMRKALADLRVAMGGDVPLVIGDERVTTDKKFDSLNPSRPGEIIGRISQADATLVDKCVDVAREAFKSWRRVGAHERAGYLFQVAKMMQQRRFELAAIVCLECGKPWREADADISESIDFCNYYGKEMLRMADNVRRRDVPGETNEYYYTPRGVVAIISPWNFPLAILTGMTVAAVVTGNAVILKPSQQATVIASKLMEMFEQAGLPPGVLNYLPGPGSKVGARLVAHPHVAMLAFTGSREVGCNINQVAAATSTEQPALKKVIAEMGGKNATIVDADADLDEAVHGCVYAGFGYAGQKCSAGSRIIVLEDVYDRFVERYVEAVRSIVVGPADEPGTYCPPVIDAAAAKGIREYIEIGKGECRCALSVDVSELIDKTGGGYYIGPTVFTDVAPDARIAKEEIFGPVVAIIKAADMDEAIEIFNGTDFALTGGIFSRSPANIERAQMECDCGNFYINRKISGALVDLQPFGGFKMSGVGSKAGGPDYLIQFCEPRTVTENTLRRGFAPSEEVAEVLS
jgi:RHH-type proline utilization regulon transcriptional repressor/proline dehydrogenase/delta 1-pyrroline-5-carboxylate dehydrogenase